MAKKDYSDFDKWLEAQDEAAKTLIADRFSALENTLTTLKDENKSYKDTVTDLQGKVKAGSEEAISIAALNEKLAKSEKKASFFEASVSQRCTNAKLAYLAAEADGLYDTNGNPDWKKIKESVPELFTAARGNRDAGAGAGGETKVTHSRNDTINAALREKFGF